MDRPKSPNLTGSNTRKVDIEKVKLNPLSAKILVVGIEIDRAHRDVKHAFYYQDGNQWILCTKKKVTICKFNSYQSLDAWWRECQFRRGIKSNAALPLKKHASANNFFGASDGNDEKTVGRLKKTKLGELRVPEVETSEEKAPGQASRGSGAFNNDRVHWNDEYDMPEF